MKTHLYDYLCECAQRKRTAARKHNVTASNARDYYIRVAAMMQPDGVVAESHWLEHYKLHSEKAAACYKQALNYTLWALALKQLGLNREGVLNNGTGGF